MNSIWQLTRDLIGYLSTIALAAVLWLLALVVRRSGSTSQELAQTLALFLMLAAIVLLFTAFVRVVSNILRPGTEPTWTGWGIDHQVSRLGAMTLAATEEVTHAAVAVHHGLQPTRLRIMPDQDCRCAANEPMSPQIRLRGSLAGIVARNQVVTIDNDLPQSTSAVVAGAVAASASDPSLPGPATLLDQEMAHAHRLVNLYQPVIARWAQVLVEARGQRLTQPQLEELTDDLRAHRTSAAL